MFSFTHPFPLFSFVTKNQPNILLSECLVFSTWEWIFCALRTMVTFVKMSEQLKHLAVCEVGLMCKPWLTLPPPSYFICKLSRNINVDSLFDPKSSMHLWTPAKEDSTPRDWTQTEHTYVVAADNFIISIIIVGYLISRRPLNCYTVYLSLLLCRHRHLTPNASACILVVMLHKLAVQQSERDARLLSWPTPKIIFSATNYCTVF